MKHELKADYYDNVYAMHVDKYTNGWNKSPYCAIWKAVIQLIGKDRVADFGCGTGQFAEMCRDHEVNYAYGVDFSKEACTQSQARCPDFMFLCHSIHNPVSDYYDVAVVLETLEHIEKDIEFIETIPKGKRVIFTVPDWDSVSHVRHFEKETNIIERYKHLLEFSEIIISSLNRKKIFICETKRL